MIYFGWLIIITLYFDERGRFMKKSILAIFCIVAIIASGVTLFSVFAEPGSSDDPIVTKSYIDSILSQIPEAPSYRLVSMTDSQKLMCGAGTELILRQGRGTIFSSQSGGLADVTIGEDLADGMSVPANHLLIVPVSDGRGFTAHGNVLVLVRGEAEVIG